MYVVFMSFFFKCVQSFFFFFLLRCMEIRLPSCGLDDYLTSCHQVCVHLKFSLVHFLFMSANPPTSFNDQFCNWWLWGPLLDKTSEAPSSFDIFIWYQVQRLLWYFFRWIQYILRSPQIKFLMSNKFDSKL